jgi:hypothetical protein
MENILDLQTEKYRKSLLLWWAMALGQVSAKSVEKVGEHCP